MMFFLAGLQVILLITKLIAPTKITWITALAPFSILGIAVYINYLIYTISNGTLITR